MFLIAHRGNLNGPQPERENTLEYLQEALDLGYHVEVDIREAQRKLYAGHNLGSEEISIQFLMNDRVWVHAKSIETLQFLIPHSNINVFYHKDELCTLTSQGYIWHHEQSACWGARSIDLQLGPFRGVSLSSREMVAGICSDHIATYSHLPALKPNDMFKLLVIDVDGVMSPNKIYSTATTPAKSFCDLDFTAIKRFKAAGIQVCFLSADPGNDLLLQRRNTKFIYAKKQNGIIDKTANLPQIFEEYGILEEDIAYIGDDYYDISLLERVGWSFCPRNSPRDVQKAALEVLNSSGGEGCIAEIYDRYSALLEESYPYDNL